MKNQHLLLTMLLAALATGLAATAKPASAQPSAKLPDNLSPTFPREGVDHVVTYASWRGWGPKGGDRIVLFRHGVMIRTEINYIGSKRAGEDAHTTAFSNLDTAAALSVVRDSDGSLSSVSITRGGPDDIPIYRHTIVATDASETIAGERCVIWLAKPETKDGVNRSACITRDGVVLRETVLYHDGTVMDERRAINVERRRVRPEEVLPPADALSWSTWAGHTAAVPTTNDSAGNYELKLAGKRDGELVAKVIRKAGGWYSEEDQTDSSVRALLIFNPAVTLSYHNHNYAQLAISRAKTSSLQDPRDLESTPTTKPSGSVINEGCTWYDAAVNVANYGREECRTRDHLPLIRNEYSRGHLRVSWVATGLSRGQTPLGSVKPPASLMDWAFWGWPQLAKR